MCVFQLKTGENGMNIGHAYASAMHWTSIEHAHLHARHKSSKFPIDCDGRWSMTRGIPLATLLPLPSLKHLGNS